jgi:quercetin dioxygenase-like cupin family protein
MNQFKLATDAPKKQFPTGEKFSLADSVTYADGATVSKIILRNDKGNLTLFAFDKGEMLSEHTAPFDAIVQILDGTAEVVIDKIPHLLTAGETIIMPANVSHALTAVEKFKMLLIMIKSPLNPPKGDLNERL